LKYFYFSLFVFSFRLYIIVFFQSLKFKEEKDIAIEYVNDLNNFNKEIKEYLSLIGNFLEQQKNEIQKVSEKIVDIEREINRLAEIKGSEDVLTQAIEMAREGSSREEIKNKTGLREDEVEAIYTYYRNKI
jgi:hypothetical protein